MTGDHIIWQIKSGELWLNVDYSDYLSGPENNFTKI